jgi:hypothetical protein
MVYKCEYFNQVIKIGNPTCVVLLQATRGEPRKPLAARPTSTLLLPSSPPELTARNLAGRKDGGGGFLFFFPLPLLPSFPLSRAHNQQWRPFSGQLVADPSSPMLDLLHLGLDLGILLSPTLSSHSSPRLRR